MANDKAFKVKNGLELGAYNAVISSTAVDVFVYDTSKDSDGGAWRKRTQHTSWYNEALNTAIRGSRREFPAIAVIVAEASKVTIYDGDDPSLPMWMVFNAVADNLISEDANRSISAISAINGQLCVTQSGIYGGLYEILFISDKSSLRITTAFVDYLGNISERDDAVGFSGDNGGPRIINRIVNDVAMTVLPDAPIDPATGLPVPTIAVATDGGVSVIKDDGTVVDLLTGAASTFDNSSNLSFTDDNKLIFNLDSSGRNIFIYGDIPSADITVTDSNNRGINGYQTLSYSTVIYGESDFFPTFLGGNSGLINKNANASTNGLTQFKVNDQNIAGGLAAYTTSTYTTGWMPGDIKGAFLSSTDTASLVGSGELVTNGDFSSADISLWTPAAGNTLSVVDDKLRVTRSATTYGGASATITGLTIGKVYQVEIDCIGGTIQAVHRVRKDTFSAGYYGDNKPSGTYYFVSQATSALFEISSNSNSSTGYFDFDNISVKLADADRSVNNKGLIVNGTVTRSPVATGAELVGYSGFSASNYLEQPYNSALDFGTGDFCVMGWHKSTGSANNADILYRGKTSPASDDRYFQIARWANGSYRFVLGRHGITSDGVIYAAGNLTTWVHICGIVRSGVIELYLNGDLVGTDTTTIDVSQADAVLRIGRYTYDMVGSAALWRISATAPTAEAIKKIYEDEKVLFQENAKAVLAGTSDAVTALAYDDTTEELLVGTSQYTSVFRGLRRVDEISGSASAISASNGLRVIED